MLQQKPFLHAQFRAPIFLLITYGSDLSQSGMRTWKLSYQIKLPLSG